MLDVKKEFKSLMLGIAFIALLIFIIRFFELSTWSIIFLLTGVQAAFLLFQTKYEEIQDKGYIRVIGEKSRTLIWRFIQIIAIVTLLKWLGGYGVGGFVIAVLLISLSILFRNWKKYIQVKQHIEQMIWGQPLKEFRDKGVRPPKLKYRF